MKVHLCKGNVKCTSKVNIMGTKHKASLHRLLPMTCSQAGVAEILRYF